MHNNKKCIAERRLSFFLALVIILSSITFSTKPAEAAVTVGETDHPSYSVMDGSTQSSDVFLGPLRRPSAKDVFVGETNLEGYTAPNAEVTIKVNSTEYKVNSDSRGYFSKSLSAPLAINDTITYQSKIGDYESAISTHVVASREKVIAPHWDMILGGTSLSNRGLVTDSTGRYFKVQLYAWAFLDPYFQFINAKGYYQVPNDVAQYVTKLVLDKKHTLERNNEQLPGATVWESGVLQSQKGWIFDVGAGGKHGELRVYIDDTTPEDVLDKGISLTTWGVKNGYLSQDLIRNTLLFDLNRRTYSDVNHFINGSENNTPALDKAVYEYDRNDIFLRYSVTGHTYSIFSKKRPYDLKITLDPKLIGTINTSNVKIGGFDQKREYISSLKVYTPDKIEGNTLIFKDVYSKFLSGGIITKQDLGIVFDLNSGKTIVDAMDDRSTNFNFKIEILDNTGTPIKNTDAETILNVQDSDKDGLIDVYESTFDIRSSYTNKDSDGDGKEDGIEIKNGTDPTIAPFNWYDQEAKPIPALSTETKEIKGYVENNVFGHSVIEPRRVELHKVNGDGSTTKIAETKSNRDARGSFTIPIASGVVSNGDKVVVKIFTDEVMGLMPDGETKDVVQRAYQNPEVSSAMTVAEKTVITSVANEENFGDTFTWIGGVTEPNSDVVITFADGNKLTVKADENGKFNGMMRNALPNAPNLVVGEKITLVATAPGKAPSNPYEVTIKSGTEKPTLKEALAEQTIVEGHAAFDADIVLKVITKDAEGNITEEYTIPAENITRDANGDFKATLPDGKKLAKDQVVRVEATQPGKAMNATEVIVGDANFDKDNIANIEILEKPQDVYTEGDRFNPEDMVVKITDIHGAERTVVVNTTTGQELIDAGLKMKKSPAEGLTTEDKSIAITPADASDDSAIKAELPITVNAKVFNPDLVTEITIKEQPKLEYFEGEKLDLSKLVVTLKDSQGLTLDVPYSEFLKLGLTTDYENGKDLTASDNNKNITVSKGSITATTEPLVVKVKTEEPTNVKVIFENGKYYVVGNAPTGSTVEVKNLDGTGYEPPITGTATDGNFKIELPDSIPDESYFNLTAKEEGKEESNPTIAHMDKTAPLAPEVTALDNGSVAVHPTGTPFVDLYEVSVTYTPEGSETPVTATAKYNESTGEWTIDDANLAVDDHGNITIPAEKVKDGTEVVATVKDATGNIGPEGKATAGTDKTKPVSEVPTLDNINSAQQSIKVGNIDENANKISILYGTEDGQSIEIVKDEDGKWNTSDENIDSVTLGTGEDIGKLIIVPKESGKTLLEGKEIFAKVSNSNSTPVDEGKESNKVLYDTTAPTAPAEVDQPYTGDTKVSVTLPDSGVAVGDKIVVTLGEVTEAKKYEHTVTQEDLDKNPRKVEVTVDALEKDDKVSVTIEDPAGNKSDAIEKTVLDNKTPAPTVTATTTAAEGENPGKTVVSGTTAPNATVTIKVPGQEDKVVTADASGNYSADLGNEIPNGTAITVTAKDGDKTESDPATATVAVDKTKAEAVKEKVPANLDLTKPEDKAVDDARKALDEVLAKTDATQKEIDDATKALQDAIDAREEANNKTPAPTVTVTNTAAEGETAGQTVVKGTTVPGATVTIKVPGQEDKVVTADESGNYRAEYDNTIPNGTTITVTAKDGDKAESEPVTGTVTVDKAKANAALKNVPSDLDLTKPLDKAVDDAKKALEAAMNKENATQKEIDDATKALTDAIAARDEANNKTPAPTVTVTNTAAEGETPGQTVVKGTTVPGATVTIKVPGQEDKVVTADESGNYRAEYDNTIPNGTTITVTAKDGDKAESEPVTGTVAVDKAKANAALENVPSDLDLTKPLDKAVDDAKKALEAAMNKENATQKEIDDATKALQDAIDAREEANNKTPAPTVTATNTAAEGENPGKTVVSGTTAPNATVTIKVPGEEDKVVTADASGNYSADLGNEIPNGTDITVTAKDGDKTESDPATATVAVDKTKAEAVKEKVPANLDLTKPEDKAVDDARKALDEVLAKTDATQKEIDDATKALQDAIDAREEASFDPNDVKSISISKAPNKIVYTVGETFDPTGMEVTLKDGKGNTKVVAYADFGTNGLSIPTPTFTSEGSENVTVSHTSGQTANQQVTVNEGEDTTPPGRPTVDPIKAGDDKVVVTLPTEDDASKITITLPDGTKIEAVKDGADWKVGDTVLTPENGKISIPVDPNKLTEGGTVTVTVTDTSDNTSEPSTGTIQPSKPLKPIVHPIRPGDNEVIIEVPEDDDAEQIIVKLPDGTSVTVTKDNNGNWNLPDGTPAVDNNGRIVIPVDGETLIEGSTVEVVIVDKDENISDPTIIVVSDNPNVIPVSPSDEVPEGFVRVTFTTGPEGSLVGPTNFNVRIGTPFGEVLGQMPSVRTYNRYYHKGWSPSLPGSHELVETNLNFNAIYGEYSDYPSPWPSPSPIPKPTPTPVPTPVPVPVETTKVVKAYVKGYPDGTVKPNGQITRAEAAAMFVRLMTETDANLEITGLNQGPTKFVDAKTGWYTGYINYVVDKGLMKGYPDGTFKPDALITRAEFTQMIANYDKVNNSNADFADIKGHWAEKAIGQAFGNGRINGYPDGSFKPNENITRAEAMKIFNNLFDRVTSEINLSILNHPENLKKFSDTQGHWAYYHVLDATNTHKVIVSGNNQGKWSDSK